MASCQKPQDQIHSHIAAYSDHQFCIPLSNDTSGELNSMFANSGNSVKGSDMSHVNHSSAQQANASHLSNDPIYYCNPSDLAGWIHSIMGELHGPAGQPCLQESLNMQDQVELMRRNTIDDSLHEPHGHIHQPLLIQTQDELKRIRGTTTIPSSLNAFNNIDVATEMPNMINRDANNIPNSVKLISSPPNQSATHSISFASSIASQQQNEYNTASGELNAQKTISPSDTSNSYYRATTEQHMDIKPPLVHCHGIMSMQNLIPEQTLETVYQKCDLQQDDSQSQMHTVLGKSSNQEYDMSQQCQMHQDDRQSSDQERSIRLVHLLIACADAIQNNDLELAHFFVSETHTLVYPQTTGTMAKVATYFVNALSKRLYGSHSIRNLQLAQSENAYFDMLYNQFYDTSPCLKFAHFTANQAILEAFQAQKCVHVIDFSLMQGLHQQWPAFIQALAQRPAGPPHLRITAVGLPQANSKCSLEEIGKKLAHVATMMKVKFDFRAIIVARLEEVKPWMLKVHPGETVAINSVLQLHRLICSDGHFRRAPIDDVLLLMKNLNPSIVTLVEQEADHNGNIFKERFMQALQYYCTMFDSLEVCPYSPQSVEVALTEMYLGKEIENIVACEGESRMERHEPLNKWKRRMEAAGFRPLHLSSKALQQASMLLTLYSGEGYTVRENDGCLTLGWHNQPLIAASAWQCG